jgi:hypothetical protein
MRKIITLSAFTFGLALMLQPFVTFTNSAQPPAGHTGSPGEPTCATAGCHTGSSLISSGSFIALQSVLGNDLNSTGYIPDSTYNLSVNVATISKPRYGFQITALDASFNAAGTFSLTSSATTALTTSGGKSYVSHKSANSTAAWTFKWTAPSTDVGTVTFYISANGANNNSLSTGDQIYITSFTATTSQGLTRTGGTSIEVLSADENGIDIFPNPISNRISFSYSVEGSKNVSAALYNLNGQMVQEFFNEEKLSGEHNESFSMNQTMAMGLYLVQVKMDDKVFFKKVMVN